MNLQERKQSQLVLALNLVFSLLKIVSSEFHFCLNGPQRIRDTECLGGFIAKQAINITCPYYYISDKVPEGSIGELVEDHCDSSDPMEMETEGSSVSVTTFQEFYANIVDPAAEKATPGKLPDDVCQTECLAEWKDPNELDPEDHLQDIPPPVPNPESASNRERKLTRKIFMGLVMDDNFEEDDPEGLLSIEDPLYYEMNSTQPRLIKLLAKSMQIVYTQCAPFVEDNFLRQVLKAMMLMNRLNKKGKMDVGIAEYAKIDGYLDTCLTHKNRVFKLHGSHCETYDRVDYIEFLNKNQKEKEWKYRIQARSFVWGLYDPIVEAAWAVVDFIHGYCFPFFITNLNHHHMYEIAMEGLFPDSVQRHWMTPTVLGKGDMFWNSVMETGDIKVAMRNLDACAIAGYAVSPFKHRLERIFTPENMTETPVYVPIPAAASGGWTKGLKDYWKYYDGRGGFKQYIKDKDLGFCLDRADEEMRKDTVKRVKGMCPSASEADESASGGPIVETERR